MKRGGGRRYYRPEDVELLRGIHHLLRAQAYTIKGVQRILREEGAEFVKACWKGGRDIPAAGGEAVAKAGAPGRRAGRMAAPEAEVAPTKRRRGASAIAGAGRASAAGARSRGKSADEVSGVAEAIGHLEEARQSLSDTRALAEGSSPARVTGKARAPKTAPAGRGARPAAKSAKRR